MFGSHGGGRRMDPELRYADAVQVKPIVGGKEAGEEMRAAELKIS